VVPGVTVGYLAGYGEAFDEAPLSRVEICPSALGGFARLGSNREITRSAGSLPHEQRTEQPVGAGDLAMARSRDRHTGATANVVRTAGGAHSGRHAATGGGSARPSVGPPCRHLLVRDRGPC
jgi:hypothetical protein